MTTSVDADPAADLLHVPRQTRLCMPLSIKVPDLADLTRQRVCFSVEESGKVVVTEYASHSAICMLLRLSRGAFQNLQIMTIKQMNVDLPIESVLRNPSCIQWSLTANADRSIATAVAYGHRIRFDQLHRELLPAE